MKILIEISKLFLRYRATCDPKCSSSLLYIHSVEKQAKICEGCHK